MMLRTILLTTCVAVSGCATITRGAHEAFTVDTHPSGAHVALSTGQTCDATPCTFAHIARNAEFSVEISKPGYKTTTHAVTHTTAGGGAAGMAGNVLVGGLIGIGVDAASGATQDLTPNPLVVDLEVDTPAVAAALVPDANAAPAPTPAPQAASAATTPAAATASTPSTPH